MGLDVVEIVMALEEHFGVTLPDERAGQAITVGSMHSLISEVLAAERNLDADTLKAEVWTGLVAVVPGQTWFFQAWHRDTVAGQSTSNFTDAVEMTFN